MSRGGIETMLTNYYRNIDRSKVQFDFLCNSPLKGAYDDEILGLGGRIFRSPGFNPLKRFAYIKFMRELFASYPEYRVVEAHNDGVGAFTLQAAKDACVPVRIYHAHSTSFPKDYKLPIKLYCKYKIKDWATHYFSCGEKAARYFFGNDVTDNQMYRQINNAVDLSKFIYNEEIRKKVKSEHGIKNEVVLGHIGRFATVKNHVRLVDIFQKYNDINPESYLVLVGEGELFDPVKNKVEKLGLADRVIFTGSISNPEIWYQAFDVFIMPSLYEGLPVTGIEAQTADLPCIYSSTVPREIALSDRNWFIDLEKSNEYWAEKIEEILRAGDVRTDKTEFITNHNFNIQSEAVKLQNLYEELYLNSFT